MSEFIRKMNHEMTSVEKYRRRTGKSNRQKVAGRCLSKKHGYTCNKLQGMMKRKRPFFPHLPVDVNGDPHRNEANQATTDPQRILQRWLYSPLKGKKVNGEFQCSVHFLFFIFMCVQITKTVLITTQLNQFGGHRRYFQDLVEKGFTTIAHLVLKDWSPELETPPYPPSRGPYAIYTRQHLIEHINYAVENYCNFDSKVIGVYTVVSCMNKTDFVRICLKFLEFDNVAPDEENSQTKPVINETCFGAKIYSNCSYDIEEDMNLNNISEEAAFERFLLINVSFELNSLRLAKDQNSGQCLHIDGTISFTDEENSGQALVDLATHTSQIKCRCIGVDLKDVCLLEDIRLVTIFVLFLSYVSLVLICLEGCGMILCRHLCRVKEDIDCLNNMECGVLVQPIGECLIITSSKCEKEMVHADKNTNVSVGGIFKAKWGLLVQLFGDIMIILDSTNTLNQYDTHECDLDGGENGESRLDELDTHAIYLGIGCFICWMALTRYLNFHRRFSLLFKTIRSALPTVACYAFSAGICFLGFVLFGYVVFGPYHNKFQTLSFTISTLLSITNGDEIFATWANLDKEKAGKESAMVWWYAVYIWLYVFIFTVIAFNILIAIFNSAYDKIQIAYDKKHQDDQNTNMNGSDVSLDHKLESLKEKRSTWLSFDRLCCCKCRGETKFCICHCKTQRILCSPCCRRSEYERIPG